MPASITLPNLGGKATSTKDAIVTILSERWPLTPHEIYEYIARQFNLDVSYQAIHKKVRELAEEGILTSSSRGYCLSRGWISRVKDFANRMDLAYAGKEDSVGFDANILEFRTLSDLYTWALDSLNSDFYDPKHKGSGCSHFNHMWDWMPLYFAKKEFGQIKGATKRYYNYIICNSNTLADIWIANFYRKLGWNVKLGVPCAQLCDVYVPGDTIVHVYFGDVINRTLAETFSKISDIAHLDMEKFYGIACDVKTKIKVTINRDEELAMRILEQTRGYFTEKDLTDRRGWPK